MCKNLCLSVLVFARKDIREGIRKLALSGGDRRNKGGLAKLMKVEGRSEEVKHGLSLVDVVNYECIGVSRTFVKHVKWRVLQKRLNVFNYF